ncbi:hypothetical protein [Aquimarina algiphila]|uniref:hypothetical protein n=1 Tax=Aquimarina algiphila TaxID=2047982 RepID=UPI00232F2915|nr:hypothetical protein [Aquimarina algiphila]
MKKYLKIIMLLVTTILLMTNCQNDDVDTDIPSKRVIFTSEQTQGNAIRVNTSLSFGDISSGVISRTWSIPEGVANITESSESRIKPIFNRVGQHNVTLTQTFEESAFVNGVQRGTKLDTTIVVTVLEPIKIDLKANYINPDGSLGAALNLSNNVENEVIASRSVRYTFDPVGLPQNIAWTLDGGDPDEVVGTMNQVDVSYKRIGVYDFTVIANTPRPFGGDTISFEKLIKVIPSTDPVTLGNVEGKRDGTLALEFSREMDETTINATDFSIAIENGGSVIPATISSVSINPTERNILNITLDGELIYIDDTVTVSYTAGGLSTADGVQSDSFTNVSMNVFEQSPNLLEATVATTDPGFENSLSSDWIDGGFAFGTSLDATLTVNNTRAHTGINSGLVTASANTNSVIYNQGKEFPFETGKTYQLGVWSYLETSIDRATTGFDPEFRYYFNQTGGPNYSIAGPVIPFLNIPLNEWVFNSIIITTTASDGPKEIMIRFLNEGNDNDLRVYIDDLSVSEVILRP